MEVSDLVARTKKISCQDIRLEFPPRQTSTKIAEFILLAKLITSKPINLNIVKDMAFKAWKPTYPLDIKRLAVINPKGTPYSEKMSPKPLMARGSKAGHVTEMDLIEDTDGAWKRFIKVRVDINIDNPFIPGIFLPHPNKKDLWIGIKYERLADVCYNCGMLGHDQKGCQVEMFLLPNPSGSMFRASGPWLKAENDECPPGLGLDEPPASPNQCLCPMTFTATTTLNEADSPARASRKEDQIPSLSPKIISPQPYITPLSFDLSPKFNAAAPISPSSLPYLNFPHSPTFPTNPLKRKVTKQEVEKFAKKLRKDVTGLEPIYFDPETVTIIPRSRLEHFFLRQGHTPAKEVIAVSTEDIVNMVLNPPNALCDSWEQWKVSLTMASTLEEICSKEAVAIVARECSGSVCGVWAKTISLRSPLQAEAEAEAILWAIKIAVKEGWSYVSIEGDSKTYMDFLSHL
ncbi:hypothetical protein SO802_000007 [Lithocarpus litseifolius]|uniref:CCHC-type domain-containing protein n=1 Tax=Lithocarpus litseifolius TaxID=425828 RepID=A0AAW2DTQ9_9ROSI